MDLHIWFAYFAASWAIALSPGSGAVLSMTHGLAYGVKKTSATIAGLQFGLAVILLVAGVGVGALLLASASAFTVVKFAGAGYLLWLGWKQWRSPVGAAVEQGAAPAAPVGLPSARQRFVTGFFTNVTNPKGIVFMVAVLPQFLDPARALWLQLLILLVAGVGVGALLLASATAFTVVKVLGAGYLIWLGVKQWRSPVDAHAPAAGQALVNHPGLPTVRERVLTGFMTNVTNPKGIVFMVAVLPQFIDPGRPLWLQLLVLLMTSVGVDLVVMHGYAFLASRAQRWLATAKARRAQNRVFGGVLMAMGASLLLVRRGA